MLTEESDVEISQDILWDYKQVPYNLLWKLQRIALFFPAHGTDRNTVKLLFQYRDLLKIEKGKYELIGIYEDVWQNETGQRG